MKIKDLELANRKDSRELRGSRLRASVVKIALLASVVGSKGLLGFSVYSATKAALRSSARAWTTDLKARGIRMNAVSAVLAEPHGLDRVTSYRDYRNAMWTLKN